MAATFTITGFADEIAADLGEQIAGLQATQVEWIEVRGVDGSNVLDLSDGQTQQLRTRLDDAGIGVSCVGSPIGKVDIHDDLEAHFERFHIALRRAAQLGCEFVRVFSFYHKEQSPEAARTVVVDQLGRMSMAAAEVGVTLLHENEKGIYGDTAQRCLDLLTEVNSPYLRAAFDPANFVQCGQATHDAWELLADYVAYLHIKDAVAVSGRVVPAGHGDGDLAVVLAAAATRDFNGFVSIEHHLNADDVDYGGTGAQRFTTAVAALRVLLARMGH